MKRETQPALSVEGQQALDDHAYALKQAEDLSMVTILKYCGLRKAEMHIYVCISEYYSL